MTMDVSARRQRLWQSWALALLLCLLFAGPTLALAPDKAIADYAVDFWQDAQDGSGLPQRSVTAILQTSDGYLWLGTKGGLARFDGVRFVTYDDKRPNQLAESEVWALAEDKDGSLWIGTYGGGLSHLKEGVFERTKIELPSAFVTRLVMSPDGALWIGTNGGLVRRKDGRSEVFRTAEGLPSNVVTALHLDQDGTLWIGTEKGLASYLNGRIIDDTRHQPALVGPVSAIAGGGREGLWLGLWQTSQGFGLRRYHAGAVTSFTTREGLPSDAVTSLLIDKHGMLWIGTLAGICRHRNGRFEQYYTELAGSGVRGVLERVSARNVQALQLDREGSLWVGTRFDGLLRLRDVPFSALTFGPSGSANNDVRTILEDHRGVVWLGAASGLWRVEGESRISIVLPGGVGGDALAEDPEGSLWVGTEAGVFALRNGQPARTGNAVLDRVVVSALLADSGGSLWIGSRSDGLYRFGAGLLTHFTPQDGLLGSQVRALARDSRGHLWVGTKDGGVSCLRSGRFTTFDASRGLASGAVQALLVDRDDTVWVGTRRGLARIKNDKVAMLTVQNGLPANYFFQIVEDDRQALWLNYGSGVTRVTKDALNAVADGKVTQLEAQVFAGESGMHSTFLTAPNQPLAARTRDGSVWFPTAYGAARVNPAAMPHNDVAPPVRVEELRADGRMLPSHEGLRVPAGNGNLEIHYTGLSFLAPERVHFKYKLEGLDKNWQDAQTRRVAYFTNVPPRTYRFRVIAFNNDGVPSTEEAALVFTVLPHWWQSRWFFAFAAVFILGLAFAAYAWRVNALKTSQRELAQKVEERTQDLQQEITLHKVTEAKLNDQVVERQAAEDEAHRAADEAREFAAKLAQSNTELTEKQQEIEREVVERRRAESEARSFAERLTQSNAELMEKQAQLERENAERSRAETEARSLAEQLTRSNTDLTGKQQEIEREVVERRRAETEARSLAERLTQSNAELVDKQQQLESENTERRRAEEAAGRERDLLHALMDNIPDLIYFKDGDGRFARINQAYADAVALHSPAAAIGRTAFDFHAEEYARQMQAEERTLLQTGQSLIGTVEHDPRGDRFYLATKVPLRDPSGGVTGLVGISKDITERKRAEERLERDLQAFLELVACAAKGDLTKRCQEGEDTLGRIGRSVNHMLEQFTTILAGARDTAFTVSTSSAEILAAATQIAKGSQYGSDQVQSTSAAVEEMTASMSQVSRHAAESADGARRVLEQVREGEDAVNATALGMTRIDAAANATAEKMRLLEKRSKQIFEIIALIEEIASQSTLLSLNAAIEAAHAGDAGRGFAVVAEEIRRLADRSVESTKAVTEIVGGIVEETRLVLSAMENGVREVQAGRDLSERAQRSLRAIQDLVESSASLAGQISNATHEQVQVTQTVSQAMQAIANIAHESSAGAHETSKAVRDLVDLSEQLTRAISRFQIGTPA
jgi:PAS domain S-box-containing protein